MSNNRYDTFAHEIASLKRKQKRESDDTSKASGILCAACGLECAIIPSERTTCQKCFSVHYCSSDCLNWDWSNGGHEEECQKKPVPKKMSFLNFQKGSDDTISTRSATCCNACNLECRVSEDRVTCPECEEVHYCNTDCLDWDWNKGGHATACRKSKPKRMAFSSFHQQLEQKLQMQQQGQHGQQAPPPPPPPMARRPVPPQQSVPPTQQSESLHPSEGTVSEYTEVTIEDSDNPLSRSKSKESEQSKGSAESRDDENEKTQEQLFDEYFQYGEDEEEEDAFEHSERFLDDIPEGSQEDSSFDVETLQINRYGSAMAAHGALYQVATPESSGRLRYHRANTPDTPETRVADNLEHHHPQNQRRNYQDRADRPDQPPPRSRSGRTMDANAHYRGVYQSQEQHGHQQEASPAQQPRGQRPSPSQRTRVIARPEQEQQQRSSPWTQPPRRQSRHRQQSSQPPQHQSRGFVAPQPYPALLAPAVPVESDRALHLDEEVGTSGREPFIQQNNDGYEFISSVTSSSRRRHRKTRSRLTVLLAVAVSFTIGIVIAVGAVSGLVWFKPELTGNGDKNNEENKSVPSSLAPSAAPSMPPMNPIPSPIPPALTMTLQQDFSTGVNGFGRSVALLESFLAVGSSGGKVGTFREQNGNYLSIQEIEEPEANTGFGADVQLINDGSDQYLIVGAPDGGVTGNGRVHIYAFKSSNNIWEELSISLAGLTGFDNSRKRRLAEIGSDQFGSSVAMSSNWRLVVGSPEFDSGKGKVFIYHFTKSTGVSSNLSLVSTFSLGSQQTTAGFGTAVDITNEGKVIGVGSPAEQKFYIYEWSGATWEETFSLHYPQEVNLGSSVSFLSENYVAIGAPSADSNRGIIHVCKREGNQWIEMKTIVGSWGDRLGTFGTIGGSESVINPELVAATSTGRIRRYDFIDEDWVQRFEVKRPQVGTSLSVSSDNDGFKVFVGYGGAGTAALYSDSSSPSPPTNPPTPNPTPSPLPPGVTAAPTNTPTPPPVSTPSTPLPTPQPTGAPAPSASPTAKPTPAPTPEPNWVMMRSFSSTNSAAGFGKDVKIAGNFMAASEPQVSSGVGQAHLYKKAALWGPLNRVFDSEALQFGSALDLAVVSGTGSLLVGAKETKDVNGVAKFGSAAYYEFNDSSWTQVGNTIRPPFNIVEGGGEFGGAVAMASTIKRIAVAAPDSSKDTQTVDTGRVYTYDFDGSDWQPMADPLFGAAESMLGSSIDMSFDGSHMLVGAPAGRNGDGSVFYYRWNQGTSTWDKFYSLPGGTGESLGSSVAILTDDAGTIAFGGSDYGTNQGVIRVYQDIGGSFFAKIGADIVGAIGDGIGKTLCGSQGKIAFGTDNGSFHVYEYKSNQWVEVASGPALGSAVVSISMSEDTNTVVVGLANEEVRVYQLW